MKVYNVNWIVNTNNGHMMIGSYPTVKNHKTFSTRERAEEFYKKLYDCASFIGAAGILNAEVIELEIE